MLRALHSTLWVSLHHLYESSTQEGSAIIASILQIRWSKLREIDSHHQRHTASKWQPQASSSGLSGFITRWSVVTWEVAPCPCWLLPHPQGLGKTATLTVGLTQGSAFLVYSQEYFLEMVDTESPVTKMLLEARESLIFLSPETQVTSSPPSSVLSRSL